MRYYKKRQLDMLRQTSQMLKANVHFLSKKVPALQEDIEKFIARIKGLTELEAEIKRGTTIFTNHKRRDRKNLVAALLRLTAALRRSGYRNAEGRTEKERAVRFTVSDLSRMRENALDLVSHEITKAAKQMEQPGHFGLKPGDISAAVAYRFSFMSRKMITGKVRKDRVEKNKLLNEGVRESVFILSDTIDPMMNIACEENAGLMRAYEDLRRVLPKGQGRPSDDEIKYRKARAGKSRKWKETRVL